MSLCELHLAREVNFITRIKGEDNVTLPQGLYLLVLNSKFFLHLNWLPPKANLPYYLIHSTTTMNKRGGDGFMSCLSGYQNLNSD